MTDVNKLTNEMAEIQKQLVAINEREQKGKADGLDQQAIKNMQETFEQFSVKNAEVNAKIEKALTESEELKSRVEEFERAAARPNGAQKAQSLEAELKQMDSGLRSMAANFVTNAEVKATMRTDVLANGGINVPTNLSSRILREVTEISPILQVATIHTTSNMTFPVRDGLPTSQWVGETEEVSSSVMTQKGVTIQAHLLATLVPMSITLINDANTDIVAELTDAVSTEEAQKIGAAGVKGDGVTKPLGFASTAAGLSGVTSAVTDQLGRNDLFALMGSLKSQYGQRAVFGLNRDTIFNKILVLNNGIGDSIWTMGNLAAGIPATLCGQRYVEMPDMDNVAGGAKPVVYGDFKAGYHVIIGMQPRVIFDQYTAASTGTVRYVFHRYIGGAPVLKEALKILTIKA